MSRSRPGQPEALIFPRWSRILLTFFLVLSIKAWPTSDRPDSRQSSPQIESWLQTGKQLLNNGNFSDSSDMFKKCLLNPLLQEPQELECHLNLGLISWLTDQIETSSDCYAKASELASQLRLHEQYQYCQDILKIHEIFRQALMIRENNPSQSNLLFDQALAMARAIKSQPHELKILRSWSANYTGSKNIKTFYDLNRRALNLSLILNHKAETFKTYKNLGLYYAIVNDYAQALSCYTRALALAREAKDEKESISCFNNLAFLYISFGDYAKAQEYIGEALKLAGRQSQSIRPLTLLVNLGQIYHTQADLSFSEDDYAKAIQSFNKALESSTQTDSPSLFHWAKIELGGLFVDLDQFQKARSLLSDEYEFYKNQGDPARLGNILFYLGRLSFKQKDYPKAASYFETAAAQSQRASSPLLTIKALYHIGLCQEQFGKPEKALASYHEAMALIDEVGSSIIDDSNRSEFAASQKDVFHKSINLDFDLGQKQDSAFFKFEVFQTVERMKARSFLAYLERGDGSRRTGLKRPSETLEESLKRERIECLVSLVRGDLSRTQKAGLESRVQHIEDMLSVLAQERIPSDRDWNVVTEPLTVDNIRHSILNANTVLLEYFLGEDRSFLFFLSQDTFKVFVLPPAKAIRDSLSPYLAYLRDPHIPVEKGLSSARRIYRELLSPASKDFPEFMNHLIIVPDGILFDLPFETLIADPGGFGTDGYLLNRCKITYAPSASALCYLRRKQRPATYPKDILAFGAPVDRGSRFSDPTSASRIMADWYRDRGFIASPIPYTEKEIALIAKPFPAARKDIFVGKNATEKAFKDLNLRKYRIIHLACHAFSDEEFPQRSALILSPDEESDEDGFFQVLEMYPARIAADLVVLSACRTARGKNVVNEGVLGLPRIFFYMGSRSVISTLWQIADKATAQLMDYFYSFYTRGIPKAQALRLAKVKMLSTGFAHPYYWASFIFTGDF